MSNSFIAKLGRLWMRMSAVCLRLLGTGIFTKISGSEVSSQAINNQQHEGEFSIRSGTSYIIVYRLDVIRLLTAFTLTYFLVAETIASLALRVGRDER